MGEQQPDTAHRVFVSYIDKSREFYLAQAFGNPYRWACHSDAPFAPLARPLAECRVGLVTTASLVHEGGTLDPLARPRKTVYAAPASPPPEQLFTQDLAWDKEATHTKDVDSFLPFRALAAFAAEGRVGSLSPRFYGVPTEYSQRRTVEQDGPAVLEYCRDDGVDACILVAL
jgi:hypothetical protein